MSFYKWLWSRIGGRPWTYIIRDFWHKLEFFWIVGLVSLGLFLGQLCCWKTALIGWLVFSAGYICGHLFWGCPYEEGQSGD